MKKLSLLIAATLLAYSSFGQIITTIAGNHIAGYSGDGGPATAAKIDRPADVALDHSGNIYFTDYGNNRIRKINAAGIITTVVGTGTAGYSGDGGPATAAKLYIPCGMIFDSSDNLYFCDYGNYAVRKVDASGVISTVAGNGSDGFSGDGGPATAARIDAGRIAFNKSGDLFLADYHNNRVRMVNTSGIISTVAGTGGTGYSGDGGPATAAQIYVVTDVKFDAAGNMLITDQYNNCIRKVDTSGIITTIAGHGPIGYTGDLGPATAATLFYPSTAVADDSGNIFIDDSYNNVVRKVNTSGIISTVAGTGGSGFSGDGGLALSATFSQPWEVTVACSNLYIADAFNNTVRKVENFSGMPAISGGPMVGLGSPVTLNIAALGGHLEQQFYNYSHCGLNYRSCYWSQYWNSNNHLHQHVRYGL